MNKKIIILILIICFIIYFIFLILRDKTYIITEPSIYSPLSSSVQGIKMTASNIEYNKNYIYYWNATDGFFLDSNTMKSSSETVTWCILSINEAAAKTITISLIIKNKKNNMEIANTKVTLISDNIYYKRKD